MSRLATLDGQDIPTGRARQAAPGGVAEHLVFVPAATVTLTVRPGRFVMSVIEGSIPIPQARHDLLDQRGHSVGRHASNPLIVCLGARSSDAACCLPFYLKTRNLATEVS